MPRIAALLDQACSREASDLHLVPSRPPFARVRGELVPLGDTGPSAKELEEMLTELLAPSQRTRLGAEHAVTFGGSHAHAGATSRFRGQIVHAHGGLRASFRFFPPRVRTLAELGCPDEVRRLAEARGGLVIVAGPSGAGTTTTLAAMVAHIDETRACHIVTIEDPIEVVHAAKRAQITQLEIGAHVPSFVTALRNVAREDADVVVVSSLRGREATAAALALAASGTTVLAAIAASGARGALEQLLASVDDRALVDAALAGVVALERSKDEVRYEVKTP